MINCLILSVLTAVIVLQPDPSDVLETSPIYSWTVSQLLDWETRFVRDGVPVISSGFQPFPGWGSFESMSLKSPLEAGVWGNGSWEIDFASFAVPESSFSSGVGLIQNTSLNSRYSAYLRRPLMSRLLVDFTMSREDTLNNQRYIFRSGEFETGGRGWQSTEDGYTLWAGWNQGDAAARISFAHFHPGGRYWEALGSYRMEVSRYDIRTACAVSISDDSILHAEAHIRLEFPVFGMRTVLRSDIVDLDGDAFPGGTAGILAESGIFNLQAGIAVMPDSDPRFVGVAGIDPLEITLEADKDGFEGGIQSLISTSYGFMHLGTSIKEDTVRFSGIALPSLPWGASGRIHGGVSWELLRADSNTSGTMDIKSLFTLGGFAFIFALEDVLDDYRSYSFGITWTFSDHPPRIIEEDDRN
ncbi:MAG: hypothetical protein GQ565_07735 [Candidatus Aegiribacteria sp.]|nr:hypothetical protein [Candidatus Aegiribacteria sp.]